jgi:hypothetical protein
LLRKIAVIMQNVSSLGLHGMRNRDSSFQRKLESSTFVISSEVEESLINQPYFSVLSVMKVPKVLKEEKTRRHRFRSPIYQFHTAQTVPLSQTLSFTPDNINYQ